jgi:hypothetical protein
MRLLSSIPPLAPAQRCEKCADCRVTQKAAQSAAFCFTGRLCGLLLDRIDSLAPAWARASCRCSGATSHLPLPASLPCWFEMTVWRSGDDAVFRWTTSTNLAESVTVPSRDTRTAPALVAHGAQPGAAPYCVCPAAYGSYAAGPVARGGRPNSRSRLLSGHSGTRAIAAPTTGLKVLQTLPPSGARR